MVIAELNILRDSHDSMGRRFIEGTRYGKSLLQMVEGLLAQRTKFTGTSAETMLGALNNLVLTQKQWTEEEAIAHHKERIKAYQKDIQRIESKGIHHAELLPVPHSHEALFSQSEESAIHLLAAIEDVKMAIEKNRQELASSYLQQSKTAGKNLTAVADFYEGLYHSNEYSSYIQAKNLLSFLEAQIARFPNKNLDHLLVQIENLQLVPVETLRRSHLKSFMDQFRIADSGIQEKIKSQIGLLQQQVNYAMSTDIRGLQEHLRALISQFFAQKEGVLDFFNEEPITVLWPVDFELGRVEMFDFEIDLDLENQKINYTELDDAEEMLLLENLLHAEETTLQTIIERLRQLIMKSPKREINLLDHEFNYGLAEYYVLSEVELFSSEFSVSFVGKKDLNCRGRGTDYFLKGAPCFVIGLKKEK